MNQKQYDAGKESTHETFKYFIDGFPSLRQENIEEYIFHYIEHDEPQIAYSNLVAMIVNSSEILNNDLCREIIRFGRDIQMQNGVLWDQNEANARWDELEKKCSLNYTKKSS